MRMNSSHPHRNLRNAMIMTLALLSAGMLSACEATLPQQKLPELTFSHLKPIKLNVSALTIENKYISPVVRPNVEGLFPTPPAKAMKNWARRRISPTGEANGNQAVFIIDQASVIEKVLQKDTSLSGAFTKQQSQQYDLKASARLIIKDAAGNQLASVAVKSSRYTTVREDVSIYEREIIWLDITEQLMQDFDRDMIKSIQQHLSGWIKN